MILFVIIFTWDDASAHRDGCHRWHSCPSDSGSYTCGDTGYCSECPDNQYCKAGQPSSDDSEYSGSGSGFQEETIQSDLNISVRPNRDVMPAGKPQMIFVNVKSSERSVSDATVYVQVTYTDGHSKSFEGKTSSSGETFFSWTIENNSSPGMFLVKASAHKDGYNAASAESSFVVTAEKKTVQEEKPVATPEIKPAPKPETKPKTNTNTKTGQCSGTGLCITDRVMKIVDGDTIYIKNHKIRLSLTNTPEKNESGFNEAKSFTAKLCPVRSVITIDQDDKQPYDAYGRMVGKVTCSGRVLNSELLENEHANILTKYCKKSEFAGENWAKKNGC